MKFRALLLVAALVACLMPFAFGQGSTSPAQPQDPTAQAPAANPPATPKTFPDSTGASSSSTQSQPADQSGSQASSPSSTQSQPADQSGSQASSPASSQSSSSADQSSAQSSSTTGTSSSSATATSTDNKNSFTGSIVKSGSKYQLRSGGTDYELDDQSQAKNFEGKDVKVNGSLDKSTNTIKVQSIEPASPMQ